MKWLQIPLDEQETIITIDYFEKVVELYTSRSIVYKKVVKKIGESTDINIFNNKISGAIWKIPFNERSKISKMLTLANLLMLKEKA